MSCIKFRNPVILLGISAEGDLGRKWFSGWCTSPLKVTETHSTNQHTPYSERPKKPDILRYGIAEVAGWNDSPLQLRATRWGQAKIFLFSLIPQSKLSAEPYTTTQAFLIFRMYLYIILKIWEKKILPENFMVMVLEVRVSARNASSKLSKHSCSYGERWKWLFLSVLLHHKL